MNPSTELKAQILAHAREDMSRECCGLIINAGGKARYFPCKNVAPVAPELELEQFVMDPRDYVEAKKAGDILTIVHSHPMHPPRPSDADKVECERSKLPWYIVNPRTAEDHYFEPSGYVQPILGRQFVYGVFDCYTLIRDWYRQERDIELPYFESEFNWWKKPKGEPGWNMYRDNFASAGFVEISRDRVQEGDLLFMRHMTDRDNHAAIWLADGRILHHALNRLSCREVYDSYWRHMTTGAFHYVGPAE